MRNLVFAFILFPTIVVCQTFEKLLGDHFYQIPTDAIELNDSYVLATIFAENSHDLSSANYKARILKINKNTQDITYSNIIENISLGQMCLLKMSDTSFLLTYFSTNEHDSLFIRFAQLNSDLRTKITYSFYISFEGGINLNLVSSISKIGEQYFFFSAGFFNPFYAQYNSVFTLHSNFEFTDIVYNHYVRTDFAPLTISIISYLDADSALLAFNNRAFKVNNQAQICDSFPADFMRFYYPNSIPHVNTTSAHWIENNLYLGGAGYAIAKYNIFEKDTIVNYFDDEYARAAYYEPMSVNRSKIFLTGIMGYNPALYWSNEVGDESYINLFHVDSSLNLIWTRNYNVNDGYYYFPFNTLATSDGGCLIAGTRNNYNLQGRKVDLYLLKVDSLGNYTPMVGLENPSSTLQTLVYPNPGTATLTIETPEGTAGNTFRMYNSTGTLMLQQLLQTETETIDVSILPSGIYIYETQNHNGMVERGKWVKMD